MKFTTRDAIIEYIMGINGFASGKEIADIVHCSPQNVSYHIERLRTEGMDIEVSHKGYRYVKENDKKLLNLKENFKKYGLIFEYIRSCLELLSLHSAKSEKRGLFYTFNEALFFSGNKLGNLSFSLYFEKDFFVKDYVIEILNNYIGEGALIKDLDNYIMWDDYIIGRYSTREGVEHFQLILNNRGIKNINEMEVRSISELSGSYIGIKGFSVLIFEKLYERLAH